MKKTVKMMTELITDPERRSKFGRERIGMLRRLRTAIFRSIIPEVDISEDGLWTLFRTKERFAMVIAREVADEIDNDFDRRDGVSFLDAFDTICRACTPDCINKIFRMMFKEPVYFKENLGISVIQWIASIPSTSDHSFTVTVSPVKVEYLTEFCVRANMLTAKGPYISAKFTTTKEGTDAVTSGLFEVYAAASTAFDEEWDLPGVLRYSVVVDVAYSLSTSLASDKDLVMEIIRRCFADVLYERGLWTGCFGENHPRTTKKCTAYYSVVIGISRKCPLTDMSHMVKSEKKTATVSAEVYTAFLDWTTGSNECSDPIEVPNFSISGDKAESGHDENLFMITIYPPLESRPTKPAVNTVMDINLSKDNSGNSGEDRNDDIEPPANSRGNSNSRGNFVDVTEG